MSREADFRQDAQYNLRRILADLRHPAHRVARHAEEVKRESAVDALERRLLYLFASLPEDTRMSAIIGIRSAKIPKRNEHNGETVDHMIRQKAAFKLDVSEDDGAERFAKGAMALFDKLEAQARNDRKTRS